MNFETKNNELRKIIKEKLSPFITTDCCLLSLPYRHTNVGDFLIWQGAECLLKELSVKCVYRAPILEYNQKRIPPKTTILLNGGGSFGDTWESAPTTWRQIIKECPDNKIIILPQTVFYSDKEKLLSDADLLGRHNNLVLCARDNRSYEILKQYFHSNTILLVPDMAFYIPYNELQKYQKTKIKIKNNEKTLFLKRADKELNTDIDYSHVPKDNIDISDWITIDKRPLSFFILCKLWRLRSKAPCFQRIIDIYAYYLYKNDMIKKGVEFISKYNNVFATRLHAAILCCLLHKSFVLFNNSYGKNSSFFETWLTDLDNVMFHTQGKG